MKRRLRGAGKLRGILRPAYPDLQSRGEVVAAAEALRDAGVTKSPSTITAICAQTNLAWIGDALAAFGD